MTVAELIEQLQKYPAACKVYINAEDWNAQVAASTVTITETEFQTDPWCSAHGFIAVEHWRGGKYGVCGICNPPGHRVDLDNPHTWQLRRRAVRLDEQQVVIGGRA